MTPDKIMKLALSMHPADRMLALEYMLDLSEKELDYFFEKSTSAWVPVKDYQYIESSDKGDAYKCDGGYLCFNNNIWYVKRGAKTVENHGYKIINR